MDKGCIFCKIVKGEIPAKKEKETSNLIVIRDINPQADIHLLIISKVHISDIREDSGVIWASIGKLAVKLAEEKSLKSFRLVHNVGEAALVKHMHVHLLGEVTVERKL
jgi:histidine triad (HIT) family protein